MSSMTTPAPAVQATDRIREALAELVSAKKGFYRSHGSDIFKESARLETAWKAAERALSVQPVPDATQHPQAVQPGWVMVPTEPTIAMCIVGDAARLNVDDATRSAPIYRAMLAAAPQAPTVQADASQGASPAATACSGLRPSAAEASSPSVPPAGAPPRRTIEQLRCDAIFGLGSEWAAMLDDGVLSACYDCATDEDVPLSAEEIAVARAAIHVATCSALLSGDSKKKAIKDAPALYGLLCRANNLLIGSPARGMEARSGETEGLDPKGDSPVPSGTRPETAPETTAQTAPQAEPSDAELTEVERRELLDWVSACQSAYHIEETPGHKFGSLSGQLAENREALCEYVNDLLAIRAALKQQEQR